MENYKDQEARNKNLLEHLEAKEKGVIVGGFSSGKTAAATMHALGNTDNRLLKAQSEPIGKTEPNEIAVDVKITSTRLLRTKQGPFFEALLRVNGKKESIRTRVSAELAKGELQGEALDTEIEAVDKRMKVKAAKLIERTKRQAK